MKVYTRYLDFAENSSRVAKLSSADPAILFGTALFYARECAEFALKAYLIFHEIRPNGKESLSDLIRMCSPFDTELGELSEKADKLNRFSEELTRYPSNDTIPQDVSNEEAIAYADEILTFVKKRIESGNTSSPSHHTINTTERCS